MTRSAFTASRVLTRLAQLLLVLLLWAPGTAFALDVPPLRAHVNDNADMLSPSAEAALEQKLGARALRAILEKVLHPILFVGPERAGERIVVERDDVRRVTA